ncbi:hypothetical protein ET445_05110 [Agromyces protaetiae]|uniref:UBP-type domain-containing protein n=1 Tax=Agromyces protaetiae TaxID=2509455 RepID=A0A4P6FAI6_9MICO|nr:UBP-type zinc finger domain-containing protein [Agromyces protaetiae]QAY72814.1 hypothetical protein ET445_05110 [Agromyces protaetiae]
MSDLTAPGAAPPPPQGTECRDCLALDGWWFHLRRCVECGHIGCCDSSPMQHARNHAYETGHRVATSFEPGEDWFWDYFDDASAKRVPLPPPESRPDEQSVPGGNAPPNWRELLR